MDKALVLNIQKFSIHDGEGIRTTIFFKGCGLGCIWCHNPESQSYHPQLMRYEERCKKCGFCIKTCPNAAVSINEDEKILYSRSKCKGCGICTDFCAYDVLEIVGKYYTVDELVKELRKDLILYEQSGGGVTLSGGEVMSQPVGFLINLSKKLKRIGIKINIDTGGFAPWSSFEKIAPYVDTFLYDIKVLDREKHLKYIGEGLELILENLVNLNELNAKINIRIPIIGKVNDDLEEMKRIISWLRDQNINTKQINLLPYHNTGSVKYECLGIKYRDDMMGVPTNERMEEIVEVFRQAGFSNVLVGG